MTIAAFPWDWARSGTGSAAWLGMRPKRQPGEQSATRRPQLICPNRNRLSTVIDPLAPRRRATLSARAGTNTTARHLYIAAGREFQSRSFAWTVGRRNAPKAIKYGSFPTKGPTVASRKKATPLSFALDRTYRLWQQFTRFGLLHPVVLERLTAPMAEFGFSAAAENL
jgi:hypothetical protein